MRQFNLHKDIGVTIEDGYFILTMMPSLYCDLNCPHCYLSREQRRDKTTLPILDLLRICQSIDDYYEQKGVTKKTIQCYWYGGEPTSMDPEYFLGSIDIINEVFSAGKGYSVIHTVLSSLINVDEEKWFPIFKKYCNNNIQTSFDYTMRGKSYVRKWEKTVQRAIDYGLTVSTISVVNESFLKWGASEAIKYLTDLKIYETSWLPFMENDQNTETGMYDKFAPTMDNYSQFMIALTKEYKSLSKANLKPPFIGQRSFIFSQSQKDHPFANIAAQTLFLMPNGDFCLPDYHHGTWHEHMNVFGNGLESSFSDVLKGKARKAYIRKQIKRNGNSECLDCEYSDRCVMEFWKNNRSGDDCFGAKKYIDWLMENEPDEFKSHKAVLY